MASKNSTDSEDLPGNTVFYPSISEDASSSTPFGDTVHCVVKFGRKYDYTIPSFSVITVCLRHAVVQVDDEHGQLKVMDVFFRDDPSLEIPTPISAKITKHCIVDVRFIILIVW